MEFLFYICSIKNEFMTDLEYCQGIKDIQNKAKDILLRIIDTDDPEYIYEKAVYIRDKSKDIFHLNQYLFQRHYELTNVLKGEAMKFNGEIDMSLVDEVIDEANRFNDKNYKFFKQGYEDKRRD